MAMDRRRFLALAGGLATATAGGVATNNVLLGYGNLTGTNLHEQDLERLVSKRLDPPTRRTISTSHSEFTISIDGLTLHDDRHLSWSADHATITAAESDHGVPPGALRELIDDIPRIQRGEYRVEAYPVEKFFQQANMGQPRPYTVAALRGPRVTQVEPATIEQFTGVTPAQPRALVHGLVEGFREYTFYDGPRYVAGAIEINVLRNHVDLRSAFDSPASYEAMLAGETNGLFCYDFSDRAIEAFHATPAPQQTTPIVAGYVRDARHKHAYTTLATILTHTDRHNADNDDLTLAVSFVDYTATTTAHSVGLPWLSNDPDAYDTGHRATDIYWNRHTGP